MNIGAGRVVYQDLVKVNKAVTEGDLNHHPILVEAYNYAKKGNKNVHFIGLVSDGGVHSHIDHLKGLCDSAKFNGLSQVYVHAFTDGRDTLPKVASKYIDELLQVSAEIEAYIDFPEEDLPSEEIEGPSQKLLHLSNAWVKLIQTNQYKSILQEGIKTIILGEPNVGKSSLLNDLLGEDRAIVSPIPGTTRDFIAEKILLGDFCIRIMDTAGLRVAEDEVERIGIEKTLEKAKDADFFLIVCDVTASKPNLPQSLVKLINANNALVVLNKIDLVSGDIGEFYPEFKHVKVSLKSECGLGDLRNQMIAMFSAMTSGVVESEGLIVNARHATAFEKARKCLEDARRLIKEGAPMELVASEIKLSLMALSEVVGEIDNEAMLDKLFSTFCIGK
jgi:tRNA modification GTPase